MAITKIQAGALPADVITTAAIDDASITHAKLHTTMDLSSKTVTLPTLSTLNTTGSVGIGTTSPNGLLELDGKTDNTPSMYISHNGNSSVGALMGFHGGNDFRLWNYENGVIKVGTNNAESMRIDSSGRVMIGTTTEGLSDGDNLTVSGSGSVGITIRSTSSEQNNLYFSDATSGAGEYAGYVTYEHNVNAMRLGTSGTERLRIDSSGNVGIGTTPHSGWYSNATALQIATTGSLYNTSNWEDVNLANNVYINTSGVDSYIQNDAACKIRLTDSGLMDFRVAGAGTAGNAISWTTAMAIDASGRVKIGNNETTIGDQQLFISGTKTSFATLGYSLWQNQLLVHDNRIPSGGAGTEAGVGGSISFSAEAGGGQKTWLGLVEGHKQNNTAGDYGGGLKMKVRQNGNPTMLTGIAINSDAIVTIPNQPSFAASRNSGHLSSGTFIYNDVKHNIGSHYNSSNGRFTAPVTGRYFIGSMLMTMNDVTYNNTSYIIAKNGTMFQRAYNSSGGSFHHQFQWSGIVSLNANDYVTIIYSNATMYGDSSAYSWFSGHLLG
jgi:hypothetical protein